MCFSSLVAHSSAPQPCWIKTTYFFLHVGCSPCMAPGFVKAKRAVALGLGLNIGITHIRWKRHQGADALPPIAMNFGTLFIYWFYCSAFYQQVHKQYCSSNIYIWSNDPLWIGGHDITFLGTWARPQVFHVVWPSVLVSPGAARSYEPWTEDTEGLRNAWNILIFVIFHADIWWYHYIPSGNLT